MDRLTFERVNGIKTGYWSAAKKDELIQKLGKLEEYGERLLHDICRSVCKYTNETVSLMEWEQNCEVCPVKELSRMMGGIEGDDD